MIHLRKVQPNDQENLLVVVQKFASSFKTNKEAFESTFEKLLEDENTDLIVAENETTLIGYVLVFHHPTFYANGTVSWVEELFVEEAFRKQGIGKQLMIHAEETATKRQSKLIALATRRADQFYQSIGYEASATYFRKLMKG